MTGEFNLFALTIAFPGKALATVKVITVEQAHAELSGIGMDNDQIIRADPLLWLVFLTDHQAASYYARDQMAKLRQYVLRYREGLKPSIFEAEDDLEAAVKAIGLTRDHRSQESRLFEVRGGQVHKATITEHEFLQGAKIEQTEEFD